jgi:sec-independent protein translocase protein TatB
MFDLSLTKILILAVLGLVIFGPDQLPTLAKQAGRTLRDFRALAEKARAEVQEGLGPEFADFDFADLDPRTLVRKHLLENLDSSVPGASVPGASVPGASVPGAQASSPGVTSGLDVVDHEP